MDVLARTRAGRDLTLNRPGQAARAARASREAAPVRTLMARALGMRTTS